MRERASDARRTHIHGHAARTFMVKVGKQRRTHNENAQNARNLAAPGPERVLFIGTQFSNLYTAVDTPASGRVIQAPVGAVRCGAVWGEAERSGATARPKGFVKGTHLQPPSLECRMYLTTLTTIKVLSSCSQYTGQQNTYNVGQVWRKSKTR